MQFKCTDDSYIGPWSGDSLYWGDWKDWKSCLENQAVCGIQTQVEPDKGLEDDTALNGIILSCCDRVG